MESKPLVVNKSFSHWSLVGFFMDAFCLFLAGGVLVMTFNGSAVPEDADSTTKLASNGLLIVVFGGISLSIILRPFRFVVEVSDGTVTFKPYRLFGLLGLSCDRKEFAQDELGQVVLDSQFRGGCFNWSNCLCCCCCGFQGIYVTKGYPRDEGSLEIAFEIPFYHITQYSPIYHVCHVKTYETSFKKLAECLEFVVHGVVDAHHQTTQAARVEVIRGTWADHQMETVRNMQYQMDALEEDTKANYRNHLAYNPRCQGLSARTKIKKGIARKRAAYFFPEGAAQPSMPVPIPAPIPNWQASGEDYNTVRARNKATVDRLLAIWSANDYNKMIQNIPTLYRSDYTSSSTVEQAAATYGRYDALPTAFNYIFNTLKGQYYNCELLPDQEGDPSVLRGRNKIRYPNSDWNCWFTIRFDNRGLMAHGDYFAQRCT